MRMSSEHCVTEAVDDVLLGKQESQQESPQSRRISLLGVALLVLLGAVLALWSGSAHLRTIASPPVLEQKAEAAGLKLCYAKMGTGEATVYHVQPSPTTRCATYWYWNMTNQIVTDAFTCEFMKTRPFTYRDLKCCDTDLCNKVGDESLYSHSAPSVCYDSEKEPGQLVKSSTSGLPDAMCIKFDLDGKRFQQPAFLGFCDIYATNPNLYKNALCCDTDLCNAD